MRQLTFCDISMTRVGNLDRTICSQRSSGKSSSGEHTYFGVIDTQEWIQSQGRYLIGTSSYADGDEACLSWVTH